MFSLSRFQGMMSAIKDKAKTFPSQHSHVLTLKQKILLTFTDTHTSMSYFKNYDMSIDCTCTVSFLLHLLLPTTLLFNLHNMLVLAGVESVFFTVPAMGLCFGFVLGTAWIIQMI